MTKIMVLTKAKPGAKLTTYAATSAGLQPDEANTSSRNAHGSTMSMKSTKYSQKSTAAAKSYRSKNQMSKLSARRPSARTDMEIMNLDQQFGELIVGDVEEETELPTPESTLKRNKGVNSLHCKTESIKTQLEDATRASASRKANTYPEERSCSCRTAMRSLYGIRPNSKRGSLDTTDNSSQTYYQLDHTKLSHKPKVQYTPLKQKSKTSCILSGQHRVSPVKQAIKKSQAEVFPPSMAGVEIPREALVNTFDQLESTIWEMNMAGLKCMVRLIRHHSDIVQSHMHMTCIQLAKNVRNLRSQVARAASQTAAELFTLKSKSLELECDDLVCALLNRTADTNRFIRADAAQALESLVDHLQPQKVLNLLTTKGAQHQNSLVRTTTAKLLVRLVEQLGSDRVYSMPRENRNKFFTVGANLLLEGSLETRSYAKSMFRVLSKHANYQRMLLQIIPQQTYRNVEKTLRCISR